MSLKKHIENFDESLLEAELNNPISKNSGLLQEHIAKFEESLGETPVKKSTYKNVNFDPIEQLRGVIRNRDKIIENLEMKTSKLTNQVSTLERDNSNILDELNRAKWLENNIARNTKKIYEDKIKTMNYVDSTELIPLLTEISRKKQGFEK